LVLLAAAACATTSPPSNSTAAAPANSTAAVNNTSSTTTPKTTTAAAFSLFRALPTPAGRVATADHVVVAPVPLYFASDYSSISNYTAFAERLCQALYRFGLNRNDVCHDGQGADGRVILASSDSGRAVIATVAVSSAVVAEAVRQAVWAGVVVRQDADGVLFIALGDPPSPASNGSGARFESVGPSPADPAPTSTSAAAAVVPLAASLAVVAVLLVVVAVGLVVAQRRQTRDCTGTDKSGTRKFASLTTLDIQSDDRNSYQRGRQYSDSSGSYAIASSTENSLPLRPKFLSPNFAVEDGIAFVCTNAADWSSKLAASTTDVGLALMTSSTASASLVEHKTPRRSTKWDTDIDAADSDIRKVSADVNPSPIAGRRLTGRRYSAKRTASARGTLPDIPDVCEGKGCEDLELTTCVNTPEEVSLGPDCVPTSAYISLHESRESRMEATECIYAVVPSSPSPDHGEADESEAAVMFILDTSAASPAMLGKDRSEGEIVCPDAMAAMEYVALDDSTASAAEFVYVAVPHTTVVDNHISTVELEQGPLAASPMMMVKDQSAGEIFCPISETE